MVSQYTSASVSAVTSSEVKIFLQKSCKTDLSSSKTKLDRPDIRKKFLFKTRALEKHQEIDFAQTSHSIYYCNFRNSGQTNNVFRFCHSTIFCKLRILQTNMDFNEFINFCKKTNSANSRDKILNLDFRIWKLNPLIDEKLLPYW